ncbi:hypothetical protein LCGC14_1731840 [marine sediment metagenome]|uniref:HK97 gp10 family phage protein n=1 Tax=marine sediment metagenome TaxID=412755 RepID=A0A0F9H945_9ZZZZ
MVRELVFEVKWNEAIDRAIKRAPTEALNRMAEHTVAGAKRRSPWKTGNNRKQIWWDTPRGGVRRIFTTSGYGGLLETGTGIFGPLKKRIVPKTAKALSWIGAGGKRVFFKSVKGRPATPYIRPALQDVIGRARSILKDLVK